MNRLRDFSGVCSMRRLGPALALALLCGAAPSVGAESAQRVSPPTKEAREAAEKVVQELFGDEIEKATRGSADVKLALVKKLIKQAGETTDDAAARFLIYQKARDVAAAAGDVTNCMAAIDKLAEQYAIDPAADRLTALTGLAKNAKSQDSVQAILDAALPAIDEAIAADDFDAAGKLVRFASSLATRLRNAQVVSQLKSRPAEIDLLKKEYAKVAEAEKKLSNDPDDPTANQTIGFYRGPMKGDFNSALDYLAKGSDAVLRDLAKKERVVAEVAAEQAKLADGWWDAAEHQREPAKSRIREHAADLYRNVVQNLNGLSKAQSESRIKQVASDRSARSGSSHMTVVQLLTDGDWHLKWYSSATDASGPIEREYERLKFKNDGTCQIPSDSGTWRLLQNGTTIEVEFPIWKGAYVWQFEFSGDSIKAKWLGTQATIIHLGIAAKNRRR